jgi:hypothetical protein
MAKKTTRSEKPESPTRQPAPERRRTARASARSGSTPDAIIAEPNGSPAVEPHTANEMLTQGDGCPSPRFEEIAEAAYQRYMRRGGQHGYDFDDWLDAERSLQGVRNQ